MKKLTVSLAFAAILGFADKSIAQSVKTTRYGAKAGLTYTTLGAIKSNGISVNYNYRPGFQGGFFAETHISENVIFSPQLLFTQKGGNINTTIDNVKIESTTQINYFDVPLLFGFKVNPKLTFLVGPQFSLLLSQSSAVNIPGSTKLASTSTDHLKKEQFGGNVGASYSIADNVGLNLNYIMDFDHAAKGTADSGQRNSGFAFTVGLKF
jgi:outer membrane immunogenic protein